jgi:thiol-disulfide isomerase/thioredoxin
MKLATFALAAFAAVSLPTAVFADDAPLALGAKAPLADAKLKDPVSGKELSVASAKGGKGTLVVFTCNHCPYAKAWEERIVELGNTYKKKGIGVLLVNSNDSSVNAGDAPEAMAERAKERGMQFPYVVDATSALARAFGATKTPEAFLFDKGGKLVYRGTIDDNHQDAGKVTKTYLKDALEAVSAGKAPAVQETKSMGCGIKFRKVS